MNAASFAVSSLPSLSVAGWIDVAVLALLGIAAVLGAVRGLAGELARLLAIATGMAVLSGASGPVRAHLFPGEGASQTILAFALTVVAAGLAGSAAGAGARRFLKLLVGQPADGILGAFVRVCTTGAVLLAVFAFLRLLPSEQVEDVVFRQSVSGRVAAPYADWIAGRISSAAGGDGAEAASKAAGAAASAVASKIGDGNG